MPGKCKNIVFLSGAGIRFFLGLSYLSEIFSVSAGIPDFRSPKGVKKVSIFP